MGRCPVNKVFLEGVKMKKAGKVLIGLGFVLIGVPFLFAVIGDFWSFLFHKGFFDFLNPMNPLDRTYDNFFTRWIFCIKNLPYLHIRPMVRIFSFFFLHNIFHLSIPNLNNIFYLFIPNALIISGFGMLLNHNQKIDIKKCFNKIVIIGLIINLLVLLDFFGLYSNLYSSIFIAMRFQSFFRFLQKLGVVGRIIILFIIPFIFRIIPVLPTFIIVAGYTRVFETEKIKSQTATKQESYFDGGLLSLIGWKILGALITLFTLGICYPWALCMVYGWEMNHTVIEGKRLKFHGKAVSLFGHWLLWVFLTIITLGIYFFWLNIALKKWIVKNTTFEETEKTLSTRENEKSVFDGGLFSLIGWKILGFLITIFTLGICYPWSLCMSYGWETNHTIIEGKRLKFHGKAVSLFGHWLLWILLIVITFGIYTLWLNIALKKWKVKNTDFEETEKQVLTN
jgi:uncharacterized membrane protein YjgN (DUF898 family)